MRCLVTGAAGFVGSHLTDRLLADGHEVCGIDAFVDYYPRSIKESNLKNARTWDGFSFVEGNLLDLDLDDLLDGVEWIFHEAAQAGVRASWGHEFSRYVDCNVLATQRLLEAAARCGSLRRFVYASSSSVYGNTTVLPVTEDVMPQPVSPYGVTKLAAEHLCTLYHRNFAVPTVSLRYFTVYGPRQRPDMAFHRFCASAIEHRGIRVFGDGQQTRDFTYIADVVEANIQAAMSDTATGAVMNIAGGSRVTLNHVIRLLQEVSGERIAVIHEHRQPGDVQDTFADTHYAQQLIHYHPYFTLREGLAAEFEQVVALYERVRV
jgi:nucleoside-diphosphate-sugar epimerase